MMSSSVKGFTLIELLLFIVVTSLLIPTIFLTSSVVLLNTPTINRTFTALQLADQCMEGFIGQRRLNGYTNANLACSATPPLPAVCTSLTGYTVAATITCTPTLSGDTVPSKTVTVNVTGLASVTLTTLYASY